LAAVLKVGRVESQQQQQNQQAMQKPMDPKQSTMQKQ
jgi:hypothetical protein